MEPVDPAEARREALGAFVHEVRTPLTSIRMVLEVARRISRDGNLVLDSELTEMMETSLTDLQLLTDGLQELSRLERGRMTLRTQAVMLADVLERLRETSSLTIEMDTGDPITGEWDQEQLATALHGMAEAANRCGAGDGVVRLAAGMRDGWCQVEFASGSPGGAARSINADLGYGFYRGCALVSAMAGMVSAQREEGYLGLRVSLPARGISQAR